MKVKATQPAAFQHTRGTLLWFSKELWDALTALPQSLWINLPWTENLMLTPHLPRKTRTLLRLPHSLKSILLCNSQTSSKVTPELHFLCSPHFQSVNQIGCSQITHCLPVRSPKSHGLPLTLPAVVPCLLSSWSTLKHSNYPANTPCLKESEWSLLVYIIRNRSIFLRNPNALYSENPVLFYIASLNFDLRKPFRKKYTFWNIFLQLKITSVLTSSLSPWCKSELSTLK